MYAFAIFTLQSCETKNELLPQSEFDIEALAVKSSKDTDFQNFVASNRKILNSIDEKIMKMNSLEREKYLDDFKQLLLLPDNLEKAEKIAQMTGLSSLEQFYLIDKEASESYQKYLAKNSLITNLNDIQRKELFQLAIQKINLEVFSNARVESCVTDYRDCVNNAESSFAVSSAACSATGRLFGPSAWAICQGSANLWYAADGIFCMRAYNRCQ